MEAGESSALRHKRVTRFARPETTVRQQKHTSTEAGLKYRKINSGIRKKRKVSTEKKVRNKRRVANKKYVEKHCDDIEKEMTAGNSKEA